eukprot:scaffold172_cov254-Pinguiococcus_pyrenoidosus.AAC.2
MDTFGSRPLGRIRKSRRRASRLSPSPRKPAESGTPPQKYARGGTSSNQIGEGTVGCLDDASDRREVPRRLHTRPRFRSAPGTVISSTPTRQRARAPGNSPSAMLLNRAMLSPPLARSPLTSTAARQIGFPVLSAVSQIDWSVPFSGPMPKSSRIHFRCWEDRCSFISIGGLRAWPFPRRLLRSMNTTAMMALCRSPCRILHSVAPPVKGKEPASSLTSFPSWFAASEPAGTSLDESWRRSVQHTATKRASRIGLGSGEEGVFSEAAFVRSGPASLEVTGRLLPLVVGHPSGSRASSRFSIHVAVFLRRRPLSLGLAIAGLHPGSSGQASLRPLHWHIRGDNRHKARLEAERHLSGPLRFMISGHAAGTSAGSAAIAHLQVVVQLIPCGRIPVPGLALLVRFRWRPGSLFHHASIAVPPEAADFRASDFGLRLDELQWVFLRRSAESSAAERCRKNPMPSLNRVAQRKPHTMLRQQVVARRVHRLVYIIRRLLCCCRPLEIHQVTLAPNRLPRFTCVCPSGFSVYPESAQGGVKTPRQVRQCAYRTEILIRILLPLRRHVSSCQPRGGNVILDPNLGRHLEPRINGEIRFCALCESVAVLDSLLPGVALPQAAPRRIQMIFPGATRFPDGLRNCRAGLAAGVAQRVWLRGRTAHELNHILPRTNVHADHHLGNRRQAVVQPGQAGENDPEVCRIRMLEGVGGSSRKTAQAVRIGRGSLRSHLLQADGVPQAWEPLEDGSPSPVPFQRLAQRAEFEACCPLNGHFHCKRDAEMRFRCFPRVGFSLTHRALQARTNHTVPQPGGTQACDCSPDEEGLSRKFSGRSRTWQNACF